MDTAPTVDVVDLVVLARATLRCTASEGPPSSRTAGRVGRDIRTRRRRPAHRVDVPYREGLPDHRGRPGAGEAGAVEDQRRDSYRGRVRDRFRQTGSIVPSWPGPRDGWASSSTGTTGVVTVQSGCSVAPGVEGGLRRRSLELRGLESELGAGVAQRVYLLPDFLELERPPGLAHKGVDRAWQRLVGA